MNLEERVKQLEREVETLKRERLSNLSSTEVEKIKGAIFDRTAATLASGAAVKYLITTVNGVRRAIPYYNKFQPLV